MKNIILFVVLTLFAFTSCKEQPKTATITGTIANTEVEKIKIYNNEIDKELDLTDGQFSATLPIEHPSYLKLRIGREMTECFVIPGQDLTLEVDAKQFDETLTYFGENSNASNYLAKKYLEEEKREPKSAEFYAMEEEAFLSQLQNFSNTSNAMLQKFANEHPLDDDFIAMEKINIDYANNGLMLNYEPAHKYYAQKAEFKPSPQFESLLAQIDMDDPNKLNISGYSQFITSYISSKGYQSFLADESYGELGNGGIVKAAVDLIASKLKNKEIQAFAIDQYIEQTLSYQSALIIEPFIDQIKGLTSNSQTFALIDESMEKWGHLAKGQPAPDFDGITIKGEEVKLSDLKGKNVYIDVWATWCGPCKAEQPALFALNEKYKDNKNLAFLGISIDSDKEAWDNMVTEKDMKGIQIFTDGAWKSDICNNYLISGIPRFILVDKKGLIIDSDAPRPSSPAIRSILKELAGEPLLSMLQ